MAKYTAEELDYIRNKSEEILDEYASSKWASNRSLWQNGLSLMLPVAS